MHYYVLTLFPEMITNACGESILGRASQKGLISVEAINIRTIPQINITVSMIIHMAAALEW